MCKIKGPKGHMEVKKYKSELKKEMLDGINSKIDVAGGKIRQLENSIRNYSNQTQRGKKRTTSVPCRTMSGYLTCAIGPREGGDRKKYLKKSMAEASLDLIKT